MTYEAMEYEVGYKRPPTATQFRKGVSGNPKGRPKKVNEFGLTNEEQAAYLADMKALDAMEPRARRELIATRRFDQLSSQPDMLRRFFVHVYAELMERT